jgi:hypothetical protein
MAAVSVYGKRQNSGGLTSAKGVRLIFFTRAVQEALTALTSLRQLRRWVSFVIATEKATSPEGDGKDQVGGQEHQPNPDKLRL